MRQRFAAGAAESCNPSFAPTGTLESGATGH
jgi:hypothetical protein